MFKSSLFGTPSRLAMTNVLAVTERFAKAPAGSVVHPDGRPVLRCDLKILAPYRIVQRGDRHVLHVV